MPDGLRVRAAAGQIIAFAALLLLAFLARRRLPVDASYVVRSVVCFAAVAGFVVVCIGRRSHPFDDFGAANLVTTARAVLVALVCGFVDERASSAVAASATAIGLAVTMMDGVDGWVARRTRMASPFGARFDMEVDALLILALAMLVWQQGKAGPWVVTSGLLRYLFVVAGWMLPTMRRPLPDSRRRQTICVVQVGGLLIALAPFVRPPASDLIAATALVVLIYSFAMDSAWLLRTSD
jgi:phosphatidylglycerophosphate synthase